MRAIVPSMMHDVIRIAHVSIFWIVKCCLEGKTDGVVCASPLVMPVVVVEEDHNQFPRSTPKKQYTVVWFCRTEDGCARPFGIVKSQETELSIADKVNLIVSVLMLRARLRPVKALEVWMVACLGVCHHPCITL